MFEPVSSTHMHTFEKVNTLAKIKASLQSNMLYPLVGHSVSIASNLQNVALDGSM